VTTVIVLLATVGTLFVVVYFVAGQLWRRDETWQRFRQRFRERRRFPESEQPVDPNFQFDEPPAEADKDREKS
jgi:hypothetical protein